VKSKLPYLIIVAAVVIILGGLLFQGTASNSHPPGRASASATTPATAGSTLSPDWGALGATQNPPDQVRIVPFPNSVPEYNVTPSVSPADATNWGVGLANTAKLLSWAMRNGQTNFISNFESGRKPYADIQNALQQAQGSASLSADLVIASATLQDLADSDKAFIAKWSQATTDQAWLVIYRQPVSLTWTGGQLQINTNWVEGGYFRTDPTMGPIWVDSFRMDCSGLGASLSICQQA
jgi:hypothetical protein